MADSPTARTLKALRDQGWRAAVVERWNPHAKIRHDLFGVVDVLAVREGETLAVQATTGSNAAARVKKIADAEATADIRAAGWRFEVWGWRKNSVGRWVCKVMDVS